MSEIIKILNNEYINMFGKKNLLFFRTLLCYYRCIEYRILVLIRLYLNFNNKKIKKMVRKKLSIKYKFEIGINTKIGKNFRIPHPQGIIIGNEVVIGDNCTIYQQVTLGQKDKGIDYYGTEPIIGNNVIIFAGAKVFGKIKVGNNSKVGANAVVCNDIPDNCVAVGIPAKIIRKEM